MLETRDVHPPHHDEDPCIPGAPLQDTHTAHLLAQITFLHREVERLEEQVSRIRSKSFSDARSIAQQYQETIELKNSAIEELRSKLGVLGDTVDLAKRCKLLEKQLATVNTENGVVRSANNELQAKARKLEGILKTRKQEFTAAQRTAEEGNNERSSTITALKMVAESLTKERDVLKKQLEAQLRNTHVVRVDKETHTQSCTQDAQTQIDAVERLTQGCQVCTAQPTQDEPERVGLSASHLAALLEEKTRECDDLRSRIEDLNAVQVDAFTMLEAARKQLKDESERRRLAIGDVEGLSAQVRGLQQRCSDQTAAERVLGERIGVLEEERQRLLAEKHHIEREKGSWEEQLRQYEKDVSQLSATKNHTSQQLSTLANDNENLREELQQFSRREAQMSYSLRAKETEVQEILVAYQKAVRENESLAESQRFLERELDNARATLASKEESIVYLHEQLRALHSREQQLTLDIQSFEYESDSLHQRLARGDAEATELDARCNELQQLLLSKDQSLEELHQSLCELSKQIVLKDNEALLLRQRCDGLTSDSTHLRALLSRERSRAEELEELNARLVAREVLATNDTQHARDTARHPQSSTQEVDVCHAEGIGGLACLNKQLQAANEELKARVLTAERSLQEATDSKERLHKIVVEQNAALSLLSQ